MDFFSILTVLLFFSVAAYAYRKSTFSIVHTSFFIIFALATVGLNLLYAISDYFTGDGITDATIYHLRYGMGGAGFGEYTGVIFGSIALILSTVTFLSWIFIRTYCSKNGKATYSYVAFFLVSAALLSSPAVPDLYDVYAAELHRDETYGSEGTPSFSLYYKEPLVKLVGKKKNLVFIYAESLEQAYSNEEAFPKLTEGLNDLSEKSIFFTNLKQTRGANYTIAGFVASQCGIPLLGPAYGNSMSGMDTYLPTATCLGDLLKKEGYHLAYYGGANLDFAGKGSFLRTHGFEERRGLKELLPMLETASYRNGWGLYDDSLFDLSYNRFLELSEGQSPFAFFMLTLDTHQPDGSPSASCRDMKYGDGSDPTLNVVKCSDYLIAKFITKILASPHASNTIVVVASDHLAPRNPTKELPSDIERSNRLMIFYPDNNTPQEIRGLGSTLDIGSTILPLIGYVGAIGLGRDLLNPKQQNETEIIQKNISQWTNRLASFWNFPKITGEVKIDIPRRLITIDQRRFKIPILVEIDPDLQTTLRFEFDLEFASDKKWKRDLVSLTKNLDGGAHFLLIDQCRDIKKLSEKEKLDETDFCLVAGTRAEYSVVPLTNDAYVFSLAEIRRLMNLPASN